MNRTIDRLKLVFLGLFALGCAGLWGYQILWVWPAKKCDAASGWWDGSTRICASPIAISSITGRPQGMSRKEWSEKQAAEMVAREAEGYPSAGVVAPAPKATPAPKAAPAAASPANPAGPAPLQK